MVISFVKALINTIYLKTCNFILGLATMLVLLYKDKFREKYFRNFEL